MNSNGRLTEEQFVSMVHKGTFVLELTACPVLGRAPTDDEQKAATHEALHRLRVGAGDWCIVIVAEEQGFMLPRDFSRPGVLTFHATFRQVESGFKFMVRGLLLPRSRCSVDQAIAICSALKRSAGLPPDLEGPFIEHARESAKSDTLRPLWLSVGFVDEDMPKLLTAAYLLDSSERSKIVGAG